MRAGMGEVPVGGEQQLVRGVPDPQVPEKAKSRRYSAALPLAE